MVIGQLMEKFYQILISLQMIFICLEDAIVNEKSTIETDMAFTNGLVNLIFASSSTDPNGAYCINLHQTARM